MRNGRRHWGSLLALPAAVVSILALAAITLWPLTGENGLQDSANRAQLTGGFVLAAAVAVVATARWARRTRRQARTAVSPDDVEQAADSLAQSVKLQWREEAAIRELGDPDPIPVSWQLVRNPRLMDHHGNIEWTAAAAAGRMRWSSSSADIARLADRFRTLRRRRLVVLGDPGMGKTTLAVQLLIHLLETRRPDEPVPVLFPVAGWDTVAHPRLHTWLTERLLQDYSDRWSAALSPRTVEALVGGGGILPVLDGLDELPSAAQVRVITALNRSLGDADQLVITSRTAEFAEAVAQAGDVLTSAAVLEAHPLGPKAAADYLELTLPPAPGADWNRLLARLRAGSAPALAEITSTPLGLWLLRSAYIRPGADPAPLTDPARFPTAEALHAHLLDELTPALIEARRPSNDAADHFRPKRHRDPGDVHRRLAYLAHMLSDPRGPDGVPRTCDLEWWRLADRTLSRGAFRFTIGSVAGLLVGMIMGCAAGTDGGLAYGVPFGLMCAAAIGLPGGIVFGCVVGFAARTWPYHQPGFGNLNLRGRRPHLVRSLLTGLITGVGLAELFALASGGTPPGALAAALPVISVIVGLPFGYVFWAESPALTDRTNTPLACWRADRSWSLTRNLAIGLPLGCAFFFVAPFSEAPEGGFAMGVVTALLSGPLLGRHNAWLAYVVAVHRPARRGGLPRDLMYFLDDAHRLGLLRAVGPVYQFRHTELQTYFARAHQPRR